jgi:hypothetical protein
MQFSIEQVIPDNEEWQQLCNKLRAAESFTAIVLTARLIGLRFAKVIIEQQLAERAQAQTNWHHCSICNTQLLSKGFACRQILTIVGWVAWKRRVGRCPRRCLGSQSVPLDQALGLQAYQQTSIELVRLGCLLAVFLPYNLAAQVLFQLIGVSVSDDAIWNWVKQFGQQAVKDLKSQLETLETGQAPPLELLDNTLRTLPLLISADGVTVPFRPQPKTPKGKTVWQEVKVAILARCGKQQTKSGQTITRLHHRRFVSVLGSIDDFKPRLWLEALRQGVETAAQVVWISDGARGFWRLYRERFAQYAVGILDFYHAAQHLWQAASAYQDGNPARTPQMWFTRMCHQLRHGFGKHIIKELDWLSKSRNTSEATKPILRQVRDYLQCHVDHIQYRTFEKLGFPLGSGVVESACKWLIQQRFKGVGMRWSEDGFNHLLHLRLAWTNQRFDALFSNEDLSLSLYSPNQ